MSVLESSAELATPTAAIDEIRLVAGLNPRRSPNTKTIAELAQSISEVGVLEPLVVRRAGDGALELIAGHRRLEAATLAGLTRVPFHLVDVAEGADALAAAAIENIAREDLTPLEEGDALARLQEATGAGVRELARRLGKGKDWVSDRLRLAELPAPIRKRVAAGDIGLHAIPNVARIAEASPKAAELAIEHALARQGRFSARSLEDLDELGSLLVEVAGTAAGMVAATADTWAYGAYDYMPAALPIESEARKEIARDFKAVGPGRTQWGTTQARKFRFGAADIKAAREAGCLLELGRERFITDPVLIAERARAKLKRWEAENRKSQRDADKKAKAKGHDSAAAQKDAEGARKAVEKAKAEALTAKLAEANRELGRNLATKLTAVALDQAEAAHVLALQAVTPEQGYYGAPCRALAWVDESLQTSRAGEVVYAREDEVAKRLREQLAAAAGPEEIAAIALRCLVACRYAAPEGAGEPSYARYRLSPDVAKLVDAIAKRLRLVPAPLKKATR